MIKKYISPFVSRAREWWVGTLNPGSDLENRIIVCLSRIVVVGLFFLFLDVLFSGIEVAYDEPYHLRNCLLLQQYGFFNTTFLRGGFAASSGPLIGAIYGYTAPFTHYHMVVMRMMCLAMSILVLIIWSKILGKLGVTYAPLRAAMALTIPWYWIISGMILAEVPAMLCVGLAILIIMKALELDKERAGWTSAFYIGLAGLLFSCAAAARSMAMIIPFLFLVAALLTGKFNLKWFVFMMVGLIPMGALIYIWGGVTPPGIKSAFHSGGLSIENGVRGLATFVAMGWILAYDKRFLPWRTMLKIFVVAFLLNLVTGVVQVFPYWGIGVYEPGFKADVTRVTASLTVGIIACVLAIATVEAYRSYRARDTLNLWFIFCACGLASLPFAMTFFYCPRYVIMSLPFLLFVLRDRISLGAWRIPLLLYCMYSGFIQLDGTYSSREATQAEFPVGHNTPRASYFEYWY